MASDTENVERFADFLGGVAEIAALAAWCYEATAPLRILGGIVRTALGARQVGVIVHGGGINVQAFADEAEMDVLVPVEMPGHTRLYQVAT